ncbi:MAG: hypothetical protein J0I06_28205 [Planctomycetes bacterium]|nr:hypothetical protein [Planctomycetota bacterium]
MHLVRPGLWLLIVAVAGLLVVAAAARWLRPPGAPAWADDYDLTAPPPEAIVPGTVVERGPPAGWSHLVIKSLPRVKPGQEGLVPAPFGLGRDSIVRQVSWMFTAFTADVVPERHGEQTRYRLRAIGLGLGANVKGRDTVLTVESAERLGASLNFIEKETLTKGYGVQQQARVVVHGPSFALLDTPVTFRCGTKNRLIRYRYALIVDPPSGRLDVLAWRLGDAEGCADLSRAVVLGPNTIDEAELIPDPSAGDIPNELTFGVDELPPHRLEVALPPEIAGLVAQTKFTPGDAHALEAALRKLLP